ncbi:MAG: HD-GYP domain-containing protein [Acidobacteria bacterium]|nr:HD-GYP domain-containing protein [Acidobacteriota bacterium]
MSITSAYSLAGSNTVNDVRELEYQLRQFQTATICALNQMLDLKDFNTGVHSTRLAEWAMRVGKHFHMSASDLRNLEIGAILHDIGKVGVPDAILNKPGKLDSEERKLIEKHSEYGWAILRSLPGFEKSSLLVLHHHERVDGKGYPAGLSIEDIPLGARIVSVIDAFDAMVSDRSYRKGMPTEEAIRRLRADSGTQFDPAVVQHFIAATDDLVGL